MVSVDSNCNVNGEDILITRHKYDLSNSSSSFGKIRIKFLPIKNYLFYRTSTSYQLSWQILCQLKYYPFRSIYLL